MPTQNFLHFQMAQEMGQTVAMLLGGKPLPLSAMESYLWHRWQAAKPVLERASKRATTFESQTAKRR